MHSDPKSLHISPSRPATILQGSTSSFLLATEAFKSKLKTWEQKSTNPNEDFFVSSVMNIKWKKTNRLNRHVVVRSAMHGFHYRFRKKPSFDDTRRCPRCETISFRLLLSDVIVKISNTLFKLAL